MNVGRIVHVFNDNSRKEPFSNHETRTIVVSIFYPAEVENAYNNETNYVELFEPCTENALSVLKDMGVDIDYFRSIKTQIHNNAKPNLTLNNYPVVLYAPAFGVVRDMYTYHIQQLVDYGFIVVSIGSTYESIFSIFPEGRFVKQAEKISQINGTDFQFWRELLETRIEDILYVMNHFEELQSQLSSKPFDFGNIGIVGHSLGGAAAFEAARRGTRIKAGVMLDASFHLLNLNENVKINTPFLIMRQEKCTHDELRNEFSEGIITPFVDGFERLYTLLSGYKSFVKVQGAHHMTFSDVPMHYKEEKISEKHKTISNYATSFLSEFIQNKTETYQSLLGSMQFNKIVEINKKGEPI
ncbi:dienelactone hydrolase family protein [Paenibacillus sp. N3/727]|uniref:alpha/beta hydrolase family protein n=1 Tax=Paenibacillus sp. N3/727 TaxID=2925845 RepID=UPI001F531C8B|nr:dienelactone hydrolase family protein [Paenibacillus sp. N3/727]UNK20294.1 dienelactone hydrolase family protein [Paenibacillus sp. N3/727]